MIKSVTFTVCGGPCAPPAVSVFSIHYSSFLSPGPPGLLFFPVCLPRKRLPRDTYEANCS